MPRCDDRHWLALSARAQQYQISNVNKAEAKITRAAAKSSSAKCAVLDTQDVSELLDRSC